MIFLPALRPFDPTSTLPLLLLGPFEFPLLVTSFSTSPVPVSFPRIVFSLPPVAVAYYGSLYHLLIRLDSSSCRRRCLSLLAHRSSRKSPRPFYLNLLKLFGKAFARVKYRINSQHDAKPRPELVYCVLLEPFSYLLNIEDDSFPIHLCHSLRSLLVFPLSRSSLSPPSVRVPNGIAIDLSSWFLSSSLVAAANPGKTRRAAAAVAVTEEEEERETERRDRCTCSVDHLQIDVPVALPYRAFSRLSHSSPARHPFFARFIASGRFADTSDV